MERVAEARIPTRHGTFRAIGYDSTLDYVRACAVAVAETGAGPSDELVRLIGPVVRL